ncbi:hybrid sensor histidine kinase/response regulator [Vibrio sp. HN007]|uniref:ATP-binding response regulator n=1 Tax=Vibrio iocasae TaxID=3098914 RepID=UPI0035D4E0E6
MHWFYMVAITIGLPFFFFYMLLMNDWSHIWVMSFMSAIFLHILLVHITWIVLLQSITGISVAVICAWMAKGSGLTITMDYAQLPVFFFIYLFGSFCFNRYQVDYDSKVALAKSFGAGIAHEMRNPLSSLSASIDVIQTLIPDEKQEKTDSYQIKRKDIQRLREVTEQATKIIHSGNETIDLLLASIDENRISRTTFKTYSALKTIENAVESFSYKNSNDRTAITFGTKQAFSFFGSDNLLKYVMFNLFKNAFYHSSSSDFRIRISTYCDENENKIIVRDTGTGIAPNVLKNIFKDFYTTGKSGRYGLGLPFCKKVMHSFGGDIQCRSLVGKWTEFTLTLPVLDAKVVKEIKRDLTSAKSILLVNEHPALSANMHIATNELGVPFTELNVAETLQRTKHGFEYDVIILNAHSLKENQSILNTLESLWATTDAQIVYLCEGKPTQRCCKSNLSPLYLELGVFQDGITNILNNLLFDIESLAPVLSAKPTAIDDKRTIMIVDDNESLRKFTAVLLEQQGFDVIQTENGRQALTVLDAEPIDLILMDIEMPGMDGIETTTRIRKSNKKFADIPIIAHTGDNSHDMLEKIGASYMSDHLIKPAKKNHLLNTISDWI